jgi:hypothetical protein
VEHPLSEWDKGVVNRLLNIGGVYTLQQDHLKLAKILTAASSLDYGVEKQRFAIGHALTFIKHLEAGDFEKNPNDLSKYYDFFKSFYGDENTQKFKEYVDSKLSDSKETEDTTNED